jgi:hypothetical protein
MSSVDNIDWSDVIKKEAMGRGDDELGVVQEVRGNDVITKASLTDKESYCIPKNLVELS